MTDEVRLRRILIVEDDERLAELLGRHLKAVGFEVTTTGRGTTAMTEVQAQAPALVLLDLRLPDISGYEVCAMLREHYDRKRLPIIILTGVEIAEKDLKAQVVDANAYLYKPFDAEELVNTIWRILKETDA